MSTILILRMKHILNIRSCSTICCVSASDLLPAQFVSIFTFTIHIDFYVLYRCANRNHLFQNVPKSFQKIIIIDYWFCNYRTQPLTNILNVWSVRYHDGCTRNRYLTFGCRFVIRYFWFTFIFNLNDKNITGGLALSNPMSLVNIYIYPESVS